MRKDLLQFPLWIPVRLQTHIFYFYRNIHFENSGNHSCNTVLEYVVGSIRNQCTVAMEMFQRWNEGPGYQVRYTLYSLDYSSKKFKLFEYWVTQLSFSETLWATVHAFKTSKGSWIGLKLHCYTLGHSLAHIDMAYVIRRKQVLSVPGGGWYPKSVPVQY
jgi:hypothetical protein